MEVNLKELISQNINELSPKEIDELIKWGKQQGSSTHNNNNISNSNNNMKYDPNNINMNNIEYDKIMNIFNFLKNEIVNMKKEIDILERENKELKEKMKKINENIDKYIEDRIKYNIESYINNNMNDIINNKIKEYINQNNNNNKNKIKIEDFYDNNDNNISKSNSDEEMDIDIQDIPKINNKNKYGRIRRKLYIFKGEDKEYIDSLYESYKEDEFLMKIILTKDKENNRGDKINYYLIILYKERRWKNMNKIKGLELIYIDKKNIDEYKKYIEGKDIIKEFPFNKEIEYNK